jgi:phosphoserine aminotransferase
MQRVLNFSPGPATLPEEVLVRAQKEMLNCNNSGMSVMEMSHRSKAFESILAQAQADLKEIMHIPDNYKILFLQGGAWSQFSMVPLNLFKSGKAD